METRVLTEFINGDKVTLLFVVLATDVGNDLACSALLLTCYIGDVFGIDDYANGYNFLHNDAIAIPLILGFGLV